MSERPSPSTSPSAEPAAEAEAVRERYARRAAHDTRYALTNPAALMAMQERQRAMLGLFAEARLGDLAALRLLEVGSGSGGNLLELLWLGFRPDHLAGIELLADRHAVARERLPAGVRLHCGDATRPDLEPGPHDIVFASTVFSSLLDDAFQQRLAAAMWTRVKPGGGVLWYDFTVDNPRNRDVRGVPLRRVRALFPEARVTHRRITLAPPIARAVSRVHPGLYTLCNALPALRTHLLGWLGKPAEAAESRPSIATTPAPP